MLHRATTAIAILLATTALATAAPFNADIVAKQFQADGYTRIEIKLRQTQAKVEAYGREGELEVIYDIATGKVLDRDWDDDDDDHYRRAGVFIRNEDHRVAFVRVGKDGMPYGDDDDWDDRWDDHDDFDDGHHHRSRRDRDDD